MSSGKAIRPNGFIDWGGRAEVVWRFPTAALASSCTCQGAIALTRIPYGPNSTARERVRASTAALPELGAALPGREVRDRPLLIVTIHPRCCCIMEGSAAL